MHLLAIDISVIFQGVYLVKFRKYVSNQFVRILFRLKQFEAGIRIVCCLPCAGGVGGREGGGKWILFKKFRANFLICTLYLDFIKH